VYQRRNLLSWARCGNIAGNRTIVR
jgi:hypothetical protein